MKGNEIISKLGTDQVHDFVERDFIKIDPDYDYLVVKGTEDHPRVIGPEHEQAILAGRYPRLIVKDRLVVLDVEWLSGHHPFEGNVEPRFSPKRPKSYMVK